MPNSSRNTEDAFTLTRKPCKVSVLDLNKSGIVVNLRSVINSKLLDEKSTVYEI